MKKGKHYQGLSINAGSQLPRGSRIAKGDDKCHLGGSLIESHEPMLPQIRVAY